MQNTSIYSYNYIFVLLFSPQSWLDDYGQHVLGPTSNFFSWCARQSLIECILDGSTIMMFSKFLKLNIMSGEDMWSSGDTSPDIVCDYLSSGRYIPTTQVAQQEVGTYFVIHICLIRKCKVFVNGPNTFMHTVS